MESLETVRRLACTAATPQARLHCNFTTQHVCIHCQFSVAQIDWIAGQCKTRWCVTKASANRSLAVCPAPGLRPLKIWSGALQINLMVRERARAYHGRLKPNPKDKEPERA